MTQIVSKSFHNNIPAEEKDHLTGLYNRRSGLMRLSHTMKATLVNGESFYAVLLDINDLSTINVEQGHVKGDHVIVLHAQHICEIMHHEDYAIRVSGDEFMVILLHTNGNEVTKRLQRLIEALQEESAKAGFEMSFSYGMMEVEPQRYENVQNVIAELDNRLYRSKKHYHFENNKAHRAYEISQEARLFLFDEEYLLDALMQSCDDYIYVCNMRDDPGTFRYSKAMVEEFGLPQEVVKNAAEVWGEHIHEADKKAFLASNKEIADGVVDYHNVEYRARNKDGKWVWLRCRGHVERDEKGQAVLFAGFITCLNRKNKVDYLTGLFNKFEFEDTINQMLNKEQPEPFHVLMLDIDEFSSINKLYNNHFGDQVLEIIAQKLQSILPEDAKIFRSEGDEFFIILRKQCTREEVKAFYERLQREVTHQQEYDNKKYHCTISAGCASYPWDASDYITLTKSASYALEHSKRSGRNCMTFFDKHMLLEEMKELDIIEQLRYSVEHNFEGFRLNFQPQVSAKDGRIVGTEALARWHCDMYGDVPPLTFIPLLEKSGMILPVGRWIFEQAVKQCKTWTFIRPDFGVSINLSYLQLNDPEFLGFMKQTLDKFGVRPQNIVVEMTESHIMKSSDAVKENFMKIRELGIRIAMDDFGTGYSSLGALKSAPADIVKIDKIFMRNILENEFDATFIKFIVRLCHDVGISVLLEGVETKEEYDKVKQLGLDYIQGYFFGKPMEVDSVKDLLKG